MYAGYFPMGLSLERIFGEMPDVPFRDHVWPKFLRENASASSSSTSEPMRANAAFEAAKAGGVVDTAVGFPKSREEMYKFYGFIRKQHDSREQGRRARVPRGLHVQGRAEVGRRGAWTTPCRSSCSSSTATTSRQAIVDARRRGRHDARVREHPDRFFAGISIDPNEGMEALRKIDRCAEEYDLKCVHAFPAGPLPAGRDQRQEVLPDLHEVRGARHPVLLDRGRPRSRVSVRAAGRRAASTRCAGSSPS